MYHFTKTLRRPYLTICLSPVLLGTSYYVRFFSALSQNLLSNQRSWLSPTHCIIVSYEEKEVEYRV